jgi:hypothetical protein
MKEIIGRGISLQLRLGLTKPVLCRDLLTRPDNTVSSRALPGA